MNHFIGIGRLTRDPELRYSAEGTAIARISIAIDRDYKNRQGEKETDFIDVVCFQKRAETIANHLKRGRMVAVQGRLQIRTYEAQDGSRKRVAEIIANDIKFLDRPQQQGQQNTSPDDFDFPDDDIAF